MAFFGLMAIKMELIISDPEMNALIQLINNKMDWKSPEVNNDRAAGITVKTRKGEVIKNQNLVFDRIAFVCSQKKIPLNVKLISPFFLMIAICIDS